MEYEDKRELFFYILLFFITALDLIYNGIELFNERYVTIRERYIIILDNFLFFLFFFFVSLVQELESYYFFV